MSSSQERSQLFLMAGSADFVANIQVSCGGALLRVMRVGGCRERIVRRRGSTQRSPGGSDQSSSGYHPAICRHRNSLRRNAAPDAADLRRNDLSALSAGLGYADLGCFFCLPERARQRFGGYLRKAAENALLQVRVPLRSGKKITHQIAEAGAAVR